MRCRVRVDLVLSGRPPGLHRADETSPWHPKVFQAMPTQTRECLSRLVHVAKKPVLRLPPFMWWSGRPSH